MRSVGTPGHEGSNSPDRVRLMAGLSTMLVGIVREGQPCSRFVPSNEAPNDVADEDDAATHARSSSTDSLEEGASARRWSNAETKMRIEGGPSFGFDPPASELLARLVQYYEAVTGDPVRTRKKRNFVAAAYRVHGSDFVPLLEEEFTRLGTAANLLGVLRSMPRRNEGVQEGPPGKAPQTTAADHEGPPCPVEQCIADVIYCGAHRPRFDPTSRRRWDRHLSNPDAAVYFQAGLAP